ncbi:MAG TPA: DNA-3-methyladenine glycosylase I, partial [Gemmatimonadales bacterium]|nr:DNA-3-methyladenine glycosylase I [Gemmatimonadales bacterium]
VVADDRATVLALSPEAHAAGITRGMPVRQARKRCPDLALLPPNPRLYARASAALHDIFRRYAPVIEPRGYGHAYLDVTGTGALFGPPVDVALRIHREARTGVRLPVTVGVGANKLVTTVAAGQRDTDPGNRDHRDAVVPVPEGGEAAFLSPHRVALLPDVAERIRERLDDYQLELIGEVAAVGAPALGQVFGRAGAELHAKARGIDPRPVLPPAIRREFRAAHTLATDTNDLGVLFALLRRLTERLGARLRTRHLVTRRLRLDLAYADYSTSGRIVTLPGVALDVALLDAARRAFTLANTKRIAVRTVALAAEQLAEMEVQMELFEAGQRGSEAGEQEVVIQTAIDQIRGRWGALSVTKGSTRRNDAGGRGSPTQAPPQGSGMAGFGAAGVGDPRPTRITVLRWESRPAGADDPEDHGRKEHEMATTYCEIAPGHEWHGPYHDTEYGVPLTDESALFERLILEINQAGLSWLTILKKRDAFKRAYGGFDVETVARYGTRDTNRLLADAGIIRNRLKVEAAIHNARQVLALRTSHGGFAAWLDTHHPLPKEEWVTLFKRTFRFTGGEITGEFLLSTGYLPGAHTPGCPAYRRILALNPPWTRHTKG